MHILLTDDNESEVFIFNHAAKRLAEKPRISILHSGNKLLEYLNDHADQLPSILFLDLNMPVTDGKECLAAIRADHRYKDMPVVMYSTSDTDHDIDDTFDLGANLYVRKPVDLSTLTHILEAVITLYKSNKLFTRDKASYLLPIF